MVLGVLAALLLNQQFYGRTIVARADDPALGAADRRQRHAVAADLQSGIWRLNALLTQIGLIDAYRSWLGEPGTALSLVIVADCWKNFPLIALIALAGLQAVPRDINAASIMDGAGAWSRFRFVITALSRRAARAWRWCCAPSRPSRSSTSSGS